MKTFKIFSTAALALMMAACSSEDAALNNSPAQQQGRKVHFTATIAAPSGNAGTRTEYTEVTEGEAAGTINVAWKAGDKIALIHNGTKDEVTVETVNENGSATITGVITVGTNDEAVAAYYPAAAIELNSDKNPVPAEAYTEKMLAQDGTLSYIASNLDLRSGESTIAVDGDKATLSDNVKLTSNTAIWKLTLQDNAETPAALSATQVSVKLDGETPVTIASTAKLSTATSSVYLAMPEMAEPETTVTIEAVTANGNYTYVNSGLALAAGKYYQSTVAFGKPVATVTTAPTASSETIYPQSTKALVNAGVAKNGTMMYRLTTSNTKPETAGDFSEDVPTAAGILNAGTYYVWYYAKGDDTHADSEIAGPVEITVAKPAATVTTAPTAKTGVKAGENAAIINAGVASGGTMMYAVTNTNTKPTSTEGFSATIPTAQSLAAGTCYVWYYVKGDADHTDSEIAGPVQVTIASAIISTKDVSETFTPTADTVTKTYFKVSGKKMLYGWRVGYDGNTITISSPDGLNLSQVVFTVNNQPNMSGRNMSHLQVDHGTLTVTGTSQGSTITISGINSPSVTLSAPSATSTNNMWTISQAVVDGKGDASK